MLQIVPKSGKPSFEEFYGRNSARVVQYIHKRLGNLADAEDLASDVFLYAYMHYDGFDPAKSSANSWLYMIVNSRIKNHYRDSKAYVDLESVVGALADDTVDLDACMYLEEVSAQLLAAIDRLPEKQKRIVIMRYFEERACGEIATIMNMTPGNVRVQLSRALDKLEVICGNSLKGE